MDTTASTILTAPGKCLISWDFGLGPTFDTDLRQKFLGECEVWRATDPENLGGEAVCIGETDSEAFLDTSVQDGVVYYYWVMERVRGGGLHQVGPLFEVEMPYTWEYAMDVAPTEPTEVTATGTGSGIRLDWLVSVDGDDEDHPARSGLVAYFVYTSNQDSPDSVVWVDEAHVGDTFTDVLPSGTEKSYQLRGLNKNLNLSEPSEIVTGRVGEGRNLVPNPRLHVNVTDAWTFFHDVGMLPYPTRVTSPPVALPAGADACARFVWPVLGINAVMHTDKLPIPAGWQNVEGFCSVWCDNPDAILYPPNLVFFDANDAIVSDFPLHNDGNAEPGSSFHELHTASPVPYEATQVAIYTDGFAEAGDLYYATEFRICEADVVTSAVGNSAIPNPSAETDTSGWSESYGDLSRVTSIPGLGFPNGVSTALCMAYGGELDSDDALPLPQGATGGDFLKWQMDLSPGATAYGGTWQATITWHESGSPVSFATLVDEAVSAGWTHFEGAVGVPLGADGFDVYITIDGASEGSFYVTLANVYLAEMVFTPAEYADGDTEGWEWDDAAHNSPSRTS